MGLASCYHPYLVSLLNSATGQWAETDDEDGGPGDY
eukprot:CAMPEP_0119050198 /NCGR_PEP_ID=MMETSP1177-20130426/68611_1 /TAXON_ID=2985 /ORGANISM="Ochromonas sp, Strain CCMP1899" /LENGTH=35 /DNA_ID= /DNA_START= /DNA_END= /DNA_ORIENTATION=